MYDWAYAPGEFDYLDQHMINQLTYRDVALALVTLQLHLQGFGFTVSSSWHQRTVSVLQGGDQDINEKNSVTILQLLQILVNKGNNQTTWI